MRLSLIFELLLIFVLLAFAASAVVGEYRKPHCHLNGFIMSANFCETSAGLNHRVNARNSMNVRQHVIKFYRDRFQGAEQRKEIHCHQAKKSD